MKYKIMSKLKSLIVVLIALAVILLLTSCAPQTEPQDEKYQVVATTTMLADLARVLGGEHVEVNGLMGPGIDPHLYKASAGDVTTMQNADLVVYNGMHLEGKMGDIFANLQEADKLIVEISKGLPESRLLIDEEGAPDPHIWFDVMLWKDAAQKLYDALITLDPDNQEVYQQNFTNYKTELDNLHDYVLEQAQKIPEKSRVLVTAHDAFAYFGNAYGFDVMGLQGISTISEAGTADVKELADYIVENQIKAIFVETSVPKKNIIALQEAVKAQGFNVEIGGELHSDSLGSSGTDAETYIGTVKANIDTIVNALK